MRVVHAVRVLLVSGLILTAGLSRGAPPGPVATPLPIREVVRYKADSTLTRLGELVVVEGTVSVVASTDRFTRIFVQDSSGAICLYSRRLVRTRVGDVVRASGEVADYYGTPEVIFHDLQVLRHGERVMPVATTLEKARLHGDLCRLVRVEGVVTSVRREMYGAWLSLAATPVPMLLRLPRERVADAWREGTVIAVTGVVASRRDPAGGRFWEIIPQSPRSITIVKAGSLLNVRTLLVVAMVLVAVLFMAALWAVMLRLRVRAATRDLTAQREELNEVLQSLEEAHELARMGTWHMDVSSGVFCASPRLYDDIGVTPDGERVPFAKLLELIREDDRAPLVARMDAAVLEGRPFSMDVRLAASDGGERTMFVRGEAVTGPEGVQRLRGVAQDVTEQRALQKSAEQSQRLSSVGTLAASLAHEFNNVLMSIQGFAEVVVRRSSDPAVVVPVQRIQSSVARGKAVSERVLRFTRPAAPLTRPLHAIAFLGDLEPELLQVLGPDVRIEISADHQSWQEGWIAADRQQLAQAFLTLAVNAREAMPSGGTFRIRTQPVSSSSAHPFEAVPTGDRFVHLVIEDTGIGMDDATLQKAFEPLFTTKRYGTGLGLPVVKQIVTLHAGHIAIESKPGHGSRVHILLPGALPPALDMEGPVAPARTRRSILLVEDEPSIAEALTLLLEAEGMEVVLETTGSGALLRTREWRPDVAILDVGLPDMSGLEVYEGIRARWPEVAVVLSTGHGESVVEPSSRSPVRLLRKPYPIDDLLAVIESLCGATAAP